MDVTKQLKRSIRALHRFFNPFESELDQHMNDSSQRNKDAYGFDIGDSLFPKRTGQRYRDWMNKEDEE